MMPVECMSEKCINCPELDISVDTTEIVGDGKVYARINRIYCEHVWRCEELKEDVIKFLDSTDTDKKCPVIDFESIKL